MSDDLPIYSESPLRSGLQFADLDRMKGVDTTTSWRNAAQLIGALEGGLIDDLRSQLKGTSPHELQSLHARVFPHLPGAGQLRTAQLQPLFRGQDCAPPEFIERSLENMHVWLISESFLQIHPVEQCALVIARIIDIWPFEFGNLTVATIAGNTFLGSAGLAPFMVTAQHRPEYERAIAQTMTIDMQPLINAIYRTVKKEMEAVAGG